MSKPLHSYLVTTTHGTSDVSARQMQIHEGCLLFLDYVGDGGELITVTAFAPHEWHFVVLDQET